MTAAKLSAGLLVVGGILGYFGADWQSKTLLITAGVALLTASFSLLLPIEIAARDVPCRCFRYYMRRTG